MVNKRIQANNNNRKIGCSNYIQAMLWLESTLPYDSARLETVTGLHNSIPDKLSMKDPSCPAPKKNATYIWKHPLHQNLNYSPLRQQFTLTTAILFYHWMWIWKRKTRQLSTLISPLFLLYCHDVFDEFRDPLVKSSTLNCFQRANLLRTPSLGIKP